MDYLKFSLLNEKDFDEVLKHSLALKELALEIADKYDNVDVEFIKIGCILHDIGRFKYPPWENSILHGVEGGKILREEGLLIKRKRKYTVTTDSRHDLHTFDNLIIIIQGIPNSRAIIAECPNKDPSSVTMADAFFIY